MANVQIEKRLHNLISDSGMTYEKVVGVAMEVVIFGSRAFGVHRPDSDLDVLLVDANMSRPRVAGVDFVILRPEELSSSRWLGSELAAHITEYGKWIKGCGAWRHQVYISDRAVIRKQARLVGLLMRAPQWWSKLHPIFHTKYKLTIRREIQRLDLMRHQIPVPPTHVLDSAWYHRSNARNRLVEVAETLSLESRAFELAKTCIDFDGTL